MLKELKSRPGLIAFLCALAVVLFICGISMAGDAPDYKLYEPKQDVFVFASSDSVPKTASIYLNTAGLTEKQVNRLNSTAKMTVPNLNDGKKHSMAISFSGKKRTVVLQKKDVTAPYFEDLPSLNVPLGKKTDYSAMLKAHDDSGDKNVKLTVSGNVDFSKAGTYTISMKAVDKSGNWCTYGFQMFVSKGNKKVTYTTNKIEAKSSNGASGKVNATGIKSTQTVVTVTAGKSVVVGVKPIAATQNNVNNLKTTVKNTKIASVYGVNELYVYGLKKGTTSMTVKCGDAKKVIQIIVK